MTGTILTRLKDGVFIHVNRSYSAIHGYEPEEMIGQSVFTLNTWSNPEQRKEVTGTILENGSIENVKVKVRKKDGSDGLCLLTGELIEIEGEKYCLGLIEEIG